jgi:hypothetical protein
MESGRRTQGESGGCTRAEREDGRREQSLQRRLADVEGSQVRVRERDARAFAVGVALALLGVILGVFC